MKRIVSLALSIALCFSVLTVSASAAPKSDDSRVKETFTMKGREASSAMREMIEEEGITVTEDTVIQLVPLSSAQSTQKSNSENSGNVLVITNQEGTTVRKDTLLLVTNDGIGFADMNDVMTHSNKGHTYELDKIMVRGTAIYDVYSNGTLFYRPIKAQFYYKKYQECNVTSIDFAYECTGSVYSYPGLVYQNDTTTHFIMIGKNYPVEARTYGKEDPYSSDYVIGTSSGSMGGAGNTLNYRIVIDGKTYNRTVGI